MDANMAHTKRVVIEAVEELCNGETIYHDEDFHLNKQHTHGAVVVSITKPFSLSDLWFMFSWNERPVVEVFRCTRDGEPDVFREGVWIENLTARAAKVVHRREADAAYEERLKFMPINDKSVFGKTKNKAKN